MDRTSLVHHAGNPQTYFLKDPQTLRGIIYKSFFNQIPIYREERKLRFKHGI